MLAWGFGRLGLAACCRLGSRHLAAWSRLPAVPWLTLAGLRVRHFFFHSNTGQVYARSCNCRLTRFLTMAVRNVELQKMHSKKMRQSLANCSYLLRPKTEVHAGLKDFPTSTFASSYQHNTTRAHNDAVVTEPRGRRN